MKNYENNQNKIYQENLKKMYGSLMDKCQKYMMKINELEDMIKNNEATKELKA